MQVMEAEEFVRRLCAPRGNGGDERVYMQACSLWPYPLWPYFLA